MPFKNPEAKSQSDKSYYQDHKFTVLGENSAFFNLRSPTGQTVRVAKAGLSPTTLERIRGFNPPQKMAGGGEVEEQAEQTSPLLDEPGEGETFDPSAGSPELGVFDYIAPAGEGKAPVGPLTPKIAQAASAVADIVAPKQTVPFDQSIPDASSAQGKTAPGLTPFMPVDKFMAESDKLPGVLPEPPPPPEDDEAMNDFTLRLKNLMRDAASASYVGRPNMPEFPELSFDGLADMKTQEKLLGVAGALAKEREAAALENYLGKKNELGAKQQEELAKRNAATAEKMKDIENTRINPNQFWESKSNGDRAVSLISIILGGLGAGLQRSNTNQVLQLLEKSVEQDVEAQKANLGKKQNALSMYMAETRDIKEAQKLAAADLYDVVATQMKIAAAKSGSEQALILGNQAAAKLQWQATQYRQGYLLQKYGGEMDKAKMELQRNVANANMQAQAVKAKLKQYNDARALMVTGPGGKRYVAKSPTDYKAAQEKMVGWQTVMGPLRELRGLYAKDKMGIWNLLSDKAAQAEVYQKILTQTIARANERGVLSDKDRKFYTDLVGTPIGLKPNSSQYGARLSALSDVLDNAVMSALSVHTEPLDTALR